MIVPRCAVFSNAHVIPPVPTFSMSAAVSTSFADSCPAIHVGVTVPTSQEKSVASYNATLLPFGSMASDNVTVSPANTVTEAFAVEVPSPSGATAVTGPSSFVASIDRVA